LSLIKRSYVNECAVLDTLYFQRYILNVSETETVVMCFSKVITVLVDLF